MYQSLKLILEETISSSESLVNFALLQMGLAKNVSPFRPGLPWADGIFVLAL